MPTLSRSNVDSPHLQNVFIPLVKPSRSKSNPFSFFHSNVTITPTPPATRSKRQRFQNSRRDACLGQMTPLLHPLSRVSSLVGSKIDTIDMPVRWPTSRYLAKPTITRPSQCSIQRWDLKGDMNTIACRPTRPDSRSIPLAFPTWLNEPLRMEPISEPTINGTPSSGNYTTTPESRWFQWSDRYL